MCQLFLRSKEPGNVVMRKRRIASICEAVVDQAQIRKGLQHLAREVALEQAIGVTANVMAVGRWIVVLANQNPAARYLIQHAVAQLQLVRIDMNQHALDERQIDRLGRPVLEQRAMMDILRTDRPPQKLTCRFRG